jgi:hypothetical protein
MFAPVYTYAATLSDLLRRQVLGGEINHVSLRSVGFPARIGKWHDFYAHIDKNLNFYILSDGNA